MRILLDDLTGRAGTEAGDDDLAALYGVPGDAASWLRVNFVATLDGAATGGDGRSGSINTEADHRVFALLRELADALVVGAGTLRVEGYRPAEKPIVVVSRRGDVPERLRDAAPGSVLMATWPGAEGLPRARSVLGPEHVVVTGESEVDLRELRQVLLGRGMGSLLCEGGPHLFWSLLAAGVVDEVDLTLSPLLVADGGPRITAGGPLEVPLTPKLLLEEEGSVLGRWLR
ncbi:MAG: dihydrofolate reductase family protein [Marmoricola sp.]